MTPVGRVQEYADAVLDRVGEVMVGKREVVDLALVALLCEGHILLEDVPGVGKTTLARSLARAIGGDFRRIQCTPDLLPSDISGLTYFNQRVQEFQFRPGPIFGNVVLADEINRATPRTQSALLEAMEERTVTIENETLPLPRPFILIATENPIELEGTFPAAGSATRSLLPQTEGRLPGRGGRSGDPDALPGREPARGPATRRRDHRFPVAPGGGARRPCG